VKVHDARGAGDVAARLARKWGTDSWTCREAETAPMVRDRDGASFHECLSNSAGFFQSSEDL
jgi:hypothetical protein